MAGLKDGDGVAVAGTAHGTAGLGFPNSGGQLAVGAGLTVGDLVHLGPDGFLEGGALGGQRQIEFPARPGKIFVQLFFGFLQKGRFGTKEPLKKRFRALRWLYGTGAALLAMLILSCTVLGVSYAWLVTDIRVEGASRYRADDLREALGVRTDDLMLGFSASDTERSLRKQFPLLASASLHRALDGTLTLTVREEETLLYTRHYRNYYLLSATTLRVIAVDATPDAWLGYAPAYIGLPEQARLRVGDTLTFAFLPYPGERESGNVATYEVETATAGEEFAYVDEVRTAILNSSLARHVTGMELSDRYDLWFLLDGKIKIRLGNTDRLADKLSLAATVLAKQTEPSGPALLDASDPAAVTYREAPDITLPDWVGSR